MKTCAVKFFAGSGIRLAVLSLLFLGLAGVCMAQASAAPARPAAPAAAVPQAQAAAQSGQTASSGKPASKGAHEGIKVHGHWTIEVRNPDGKLVSHTEFENALNSAAGALNGQTILAALLGRTATESSWSVTLQSPPGTQDSITISEPGSVASAYCNPAPTNGAIQSCSNSLSISAPQCSTTNGCPFLTGNTLTLSGSGTVPQGFTPTIGSVYTGDIVCTVSSESSQTCLNDTTNPNVVSTVFTSRNLDGQNGDPLPVSVTAGQMVSVTVVISFM